MTLSLQIAAVAAILIVAGLSVLRLAANDFDRRYPRNENPGGRD